MKKELKKKIIVDLYWFVLMLFLRIPSYQVVIE